MSVKEELICILERNKGKELSGQALADSLGVTRAAVRKAISALKNEGYLITATGNKGYMLSADSDILSAQGIRQHLDSALAQWSVTVLPVVDSTNTYARSVLNSLEGKPAIIAAAEQTSGRGRRGHSFYSPKNTGIYMSAVIYPDISPATLITAAAAVAVCLACEELTDCQPEIKWVNDVFLNGKKICGILTEGIMDFETQTIETAIVGIGVNISTDDFPEDVRTIAGSLTAEGLSRNALTGRIASHLTAMLIKGKDAIISEYRKRLMVLGKTVSYDCNGERHTGIAADINDIGNLIVETKYGTDVLTAGEISISKDFLKEE